MISSPPFRNLSTMLKSESFFRYLLLSSFFIIPLWPKLSVKILILTMAIGFVSRNFQFSINRLFNISWDILLYLFVMIIGLLWSSNLITGLSVLETSFALLAVPVIFTYLTDNRDWKSTKVPEFFTYGVVIASLVCLIVALSSYASTGKIDAFFYYSFTDAINSHPTYHAYYIIFSITIILYALFNDIVKTKLVIVAIVVLFLFFILVFTSGRTAFAALILVFSYFILKAILEPLSLNRWITIALIVVMLFGLFVMYAGNFYFEVALGGDYWERISLWRAGILANPNPFIGVGTGDYKEILNAYYLANGMKEFADGSYNTHNQLVQVYLVHGIIGLVLIIIVLTRPIYLAVKNRKVLGVLIYFPFIVYGFNEVFLGRYQGVVFLAFLHQFVVLNAKQESQKYITD